MTSVQRRVFQAVVLLVLGLVAFVELQSNRPTIIVLDDLLPGAAFAIVGLIALSRGPWNRVGTLMIAIGVGLLLGTGPWLNPSPLAGALICFSPPNGPACPDPGPVGHTWVLLQLMLGVLWGVALLHLLLVFPEGRWVSRLDRRRVRSLYVVVPIAGLLLWGLTSVTLVVSPGSVSDWLIEFVQIASAMYLVAASLYYLACWVLGLGLVITRWVRAGPARRRSMSPVIWSLVPIVLAWSPAALTLFGAPGRSDGWTTLAMASTLFLVALPVGFLVGLLRSEHEMWSVGDLVVKLSDGMLPEQLQPALARTLHDPSLEVLYWLPTLGRYADLSGKSVGLPAPNSSRAATVLGDPGSPVAALVYDSSLRTQAKLVDTAAAAVRLALENARLQVQLRAQLDDVRQSRSRLVDAADSERRRVERDLHDGAQQQLVTLLLSLQLAKAEAVRSSDSKTAHLLEDSIESLRQALDELRSLARGIHPTILAEAGLMPAIRSLADRCPIPIEVTGELDRIEPKMETALYFVAAEAITNAVKHSNGQRIRVDLCRTSGWASVDISDDGIGGADLSRGTGLVGLADRIAAVGGRLNVLSSDLNGTTLHAEVPCG
jgi:signal transduction histidine kinase